MNTALPRSVSSPTQNASPKLDALSNERLIANLKNLVSEERRLTTEVLRYLSECESRMLYAEMGYPSLFDFCTKYLGYSEGSASRRINSMRLLKMLPEPVMRQTEERVKTGELTLTNLSLAHAFLKIEKKQAGKSYSEQQKTELLESLKNVSKREAEKKLAQIQPKLIPSQKEQVITQNLTQVQFVADDGLMNKLARIKQVLAHVNPNPTYAELLNYLADFYLQKKDKRIKAERMSRSMERGKAGNRDSAPLAESNKAAMHPKSPPTITKPKPAFRSRYIPAAIRHQVWVRDQNRCTYTDPKTGHECGSKFGLELDHQTPFALGGRHTVENLRLRCRAHNEWHRVQVFGRPRRHSRSAVQ